MPRHAFFSRVLFCRPVHRHQARVAGGDRAALLQRQGHRGQRRQEAAQGGRGRFEGPKKAREECRGVRDGVLPAQIS